MLVDKYQAYHDVNDLKNASRLADWLMNTWQRKDGAYVNHNTVYTSVIYVAKSMLELTLEGRRLGKTDKTWAAAARRHYQSAKRAIDLVDPYLKVKQTCSADTGVTEDSLSFDNPHPELYETRSFVIGEQYVNMISDWQTVNTQDNDVHELFKCMGEAMLVNAFVVEREDGSLIGYNCKIKRTENMLEVLADEKQIVNLHCNLKSPYQVSFCGQTRNLKKNYRGWAFGEDIYK